MSHEAVLRDIAGKLPVRPNSARRMLWLVCMVIGVAAFAFLLFTNPLRAWGSWARRRVTEPLPILRSAC